MTLLAGWNRDEGGSDTGVPEDQSPAAVLQSTAKKEFGDKAAEFLRLYPAISDAEAARSLIDFKGDSNNAWSDWRWLEAAAAAGKKPVYRYRFDLSLPNDAPGKPGLGAYHSAEIEYVFATLDSKPGRAWRAEDRALSALMQKYWTNFARAGDPNGAGLPVWPDYRASEGWPVMHLDAVSKAEKDGLRERYLFLGAVWAK